MKHRIYGLLGACAVIASCPVDSAFAKGSGISGYSGSPVTSSRNCTSCHDGGIKPAVSIIGPTTVLPGTVNNYILRITGGQNAFGGVDVSTTAGTLQSPTTQTKILNSELVHSVEKAATNGVVEFSFRLLTPSSAGTLTLYGSGLSSDGSGTGGDEVGLANLVVKVQAPAPSPTPSPTVSPKPSPTPSPTVSPKPSPTPSPTVSPKPSPTPSPTVSPKPSPTPSPTPTPTNAAPVANAGGPYTAIVGESITFDGSASKDSDGTVVSYAWDFGDGTKSTGVKPIHKYTAAGTYTVTLIVMDNQGAAGRATATATVKASINNALPVADAGGPYTASRAGRIRFDGSASKDSDGTIVDYKWDFGDGTSGSGVAPTHRYTAIGTYDVVLTVTDDTGAKASATVVVKISDTRRTKPTR